MPTPNKNKTKTKRAGKTFIGRVVSAKMQDTITVLLSYQSRHPIYKKIIKKSKKIYAQNNLLAHQGDVVKVIECRPLSKLKKFTTLQIIKKHGSA